MSGICHHKKRTVIKIQLLQFLNVFVSVDYISRHSYLRFCLALFCFVFCFWQFPHFARLWSKRPMIYLITVRSNLFSFFYKTYIRRFCSIATTEDIFKLIPLFWKNILSFENNISKAAIALGKVTGGSKLTTLCTLSFSLQELRWSFQVWWQDLMVWVNLKFSVIRKQPVEVGQCFRRDRMVL